METIRRTNQFKAYEAWMGDLAEYLHIGDHLCPELVAHFLEIMPPACHARDLIQLGEPSDHQGDGGRARFATIQLHHSDWVYTGLRASGEHVRIEDSVRRHDCGRPYSPQNTTYCWFCHCG